MKNNINYDLLFENEVQKIKDLQYKPSLLLHVCCAPCFSGCISRLIKYFDVTAYFSNSNIDNFEEFNKRLDVLERYIKNNDYNIKVVKDNYNHEDFLNYIKGLENEKEGGKRCDKCFEYRLKKSFEYALENNLEYITTTLTISPHKNVEIINLIGKRLEKEYNIKYLYSDFKKRDGYLNSIKLSKQYNLYRQIYCGCEFSK